jgi:hypothetical protein
MLEKRLSDEVLVSRVVTDLVAGAGLKFAERGWFRAHCVGFGGHAVGSGLSLSTT